MAIKGSIDTRRKNRYRLAPRPEGVQSDMPEDIPIEVYSDSFRFTVSPYGLAVSFATNPAHPAPGKAEPGKEHVVVRMSLEQAKILAMMLRRNLKRYEEENALEIALPPNLYTQLGLAREDWGSIR